MSEPRYHLDDFNTTCQLCTTWPTGPCPQCFWGPTNPHLAQQETRMALNTITAELTRRQSPDYLEKRRLSMAVDLAPTLDLCKALMLGERVDIRLLNPDAVKRYGLR